MDLTTYYSPIVFTKIADIVIIPPNLNFSLKQVENKEQILIYCLHTDYAFQYINDYVLTHIAVKFVIISAMEDTTFPLEVNSKILQTITTMPNFVHWFCINKQMLDDYNFTSIPYGLNFWTNGDSFEQDRELCFIARKEAHFSKRIKKIYVNCHLQFTDKRHGNFRCRVSEFIPSAITHYQSCKLPRSQYFEEIAKYAFVLSPFGNGYDCIRTYEALVLGCIPILHRSFPGIDMLYDDLPVIIVNHWKEVSEELLDKALENFKIRSFNYKKLTMKYWVDKVLDKLDNTV